MMRALAAGALSLAGLACFAASCEDTSPPVPCVNAPPGGCGEDLGADVCGDPSCDAVYQCKNGTWVFERTCPPRGHPGDAADRGTGERDARVSSRLSGTAPTL
jgi:hypothetical protein